MASSIRKVRIFLASPGDVPLERQAVADVVDEINLILPALAPEKGVILELVRWETHVAPGLGDPQAVVSRQVGPYDLFVGVMWKRFGSPTAVADSGTEEEFGQAHALWKEDHALPVLFYFCEEPSPPPQTVEEVEQLRKVVEFRKRIEGRGLTWRYGAHAEFKDVIRLHLVKVLGEMLNPEVSLAASAGTFARAATESPTSPVLDQVRRLAREYESVRESMPSSPARTARMEAVTRQMKAMSTTAYSLVGHLVESSSAGERAAVAMLEMIPDPERLDWLGGRFGAEAPFVEYHAAAALLTAVRDLDPEHRPRLRPLVESAARDLEARDVRADSDRVRTLRWALRELEAQAEAGAG